MASLAAWATAPEAALTDSDQIALSPSGWQAEGHCVPSGLASTATPRMGVPGLETRLQYGLEPS